MQYTADNDLNKFSTTTISQQLGSGSSGNISIFSLNPGDLDKRVEREEREREEGGGGTSILSSRTALRSNIPCLGGAISQVSKVRCISLLACPAAAVRPRRGEIYFNNLLSYTGIEGGRSWTDALGLANGAGVPRG